MDTGLNKILNLAKKTGDNVIVFDQNNPENSYVILALKNYERLVGEAEDASFLTEDDMADKINRDIAFWDEDEEADFLPSEFGDWEDEENDEEAEEEDEWEEEVNYLYPTEDELALMHQAPLNQEQEAPKPEAPSVEEDLADKGVLADEAENEAVAETEAMAVKNHFNSVSEILSERQHRSWDIPEDRQN